MPKITVTTGDTFSIRNDKGEWEQIDPVRMHFHSDLDYYELLPVTISGQGVICSLQFEEFMKGTTPMKLAPSLWSGELAWLALVSAANVLEVDSWLPIDSEGRLPFAAWL